MFIKFIKNYFRNQPNVHIGHSVKNWLYFGAKTIFTGMTVFGFAVVNPAFFSQFNNSKQAGGSYVDAPKVLSAASFYVPNPSLLTIPSLDLNAPFEYLGINSDHFVEVPQNEMAVGWFIYGAKPGEVGATVIIGHLDSLKGSAIFANLSKIKIGDKIFIKRTDGSVVVYQVDSLSKFSQGNFPTEAVYGPLPYSGIRLITFSGIYDKKVGRFSDNVVVFGSKM